MRLKSSSSLLVVPIILLMGGLAANADTVVGGAWQNWSTSILNNPGTGVFWNNLSGDGPKYNIGWCLVGGGNCVIPNPPGNLPSLTANGVNGVAPANFYLNRTGTGDTGELLISITNNSAHDTFGWYTLVNNMPVLNPLFVGTQTNMNVLFTPTPQYGFYMQNQLGTYFSQDSYNSTHDDFQAFALFQQVAGSSFYLGVEDGGPNGDRDYQDMVIHLVSVPEPGSLALLGGSLLLAGAYTRRRKKNSSVQ